MESLINIQSSAISLLAMNPSPAACLRLIRDVLGNKADQAQMNSISEAVDRCRHVRLLADEQRRDGGWGPFHSRRATSKQKIASTEVAVERAINLGLDRHHPILKRTKSYILSIMNDRVQFPDRPERNDRWATGVRMFLASTLSLIDPTHEVLDDDRSLWREIAIRTFQSGDYSQEDEVRAHAALTGASVAGSYLTIDNRYALNILGSKMDLLPKDIERIFLNWLWHRKQGIRYLGVPLAEIPPLNKAGILDRWFVSLEMMLRLFPRSRTLANKPLCWIWERRDNQGLWDFGPRSTSSTFFPLEDSWRRKKSRKLDWSTRVLLLSTPFTTRKFKFMIGSS
jgi:hypothetical protein